MGDHASFNFYRHCIWRLLAVCLMACLAGCSANHTNVNTPKFQIINTTLAKGVETANGQEKPAYTGSLFSTADDRAVAFVEYHNLAGKHDFRWKWIDPSGRVYMDTGDYTVKPPSGKYIENGSVWHQIDIRGEKAMTLPGKWQVKVFMDDRLISTNGFYISETGELPGMPPMLSIEEISFSKGYLEGGETGALKVTVKNTGSGDAKDVFLVVESDNQALEFKNKQTLPEIPAKSGRVTASIPVSAARSITTGKAAVDVQVVEPHFKIKIQGKRVLIPTRKFRNPHLLLAKFAAVEGESALKNNRIDINEVVDIRFAVQNTGQGKARNVKVTVENNQPGVMFLGQGRGQNLRKVNTVVIPSLEPGKYRILNYRYFVNSEFKGKELAFHIRAGEALATYGFDEARTVAINTDLKPEGYIRRVMVADNAAPEGVVIEDIPDFTVDVDANIPHTKMRRPDDIAVVIGNCNYRHKDIPVVRYALSDARVMKSYLINTMGYEEANIIYATDITKARFEAIFGIRGNPNGRLADYIKPHKSNVFIYYSGHGAPDPQTRRGYFMPVDCDPDRIALNGYPLDLFYENLSRLEAKSVMVVLDACFSGGTSPGEMIISSASPALIRVIDTPTGGNTTVLASSKANQISSWYNQKHHGLFTYFFLKAMAGAGDMDKDGRITVSEIHDYVADRTRGVPYWARRLYGRDQMPVLTGKGADMVLVSYK